jgi:hypothetical protein
MSNFTVKPAALRTFSEVLSGPDTSYSYQALIDAGDYVDKWVVLPDGDTGLLFNEMTSRTKSVAEALNLEYGQLDTTLIESSNGLTTSATKYANTEAANNARVDASLPDVKPEALPADDSDRGSTEAMPRDDLTEPSEEAGIPEFVDYVMQPTGLLSPTHWILKLLGIFGINPVEWANEKLTGNLDAVAHVKNALENLAEFDGTMADGISSGARTMLYDWSGHAADSCTDYMAKLGDALTDHASQLTTVSGYYNDFVVTIQQFGSTLESLLGIFADKMAVAAACIAGAGCLAEVPGVDAIVAIIGAAKVYECYEAWEDVTKAFDIVMTGAHGVLAITTGLASSLSSYTITDTLPKIGYYNAAQGPAPDYNAPDPTGRPGGPR